MDVYKELMAITKERSGVEITRKVAKTLFLGILYGMGNSKLAASLDVPPDEARRVKDALMSAVPSIREISNMVSTELKEGSYVRTWGGRCYYSEPPKLINNRLVTFEYKGINLLCQGSAADETKEAVCRLTEALAGVEGTRMLLSVHDEIIIVSPTQTAAANMKILKQAMEGLELDVPLLSEGEIGYRWGQMKEYKDE
jgi:DNA polymerase-1